MRIEVCPSDSLDRMVAIYELTYINLTPKKHIMYNLNCFLKNKNSICIIASDESGTDLGFILGNVYYFGDKKYAKIDEICVTGVEQGKGIGKKLMNEFERKASESEVSCIYLEQYKNERLDRFYSNIGYSMAEDKEFRFKEF